jgi:hypothetical protein
VVDINIQKSGLGMLVRAKVMVFDKIEFAYFLMILYTVTNIIINMFPEMG